MGQDEGDSLLQKFARMLEECFDSNCVVARIDGDEFGIIVPGANLGSLEDMCRRLKLTTVNILLETVVLNVSVGFALRKGKDQSIDDLFKEAERNMRREKVHHVQSSRSDIIKVLTEALKARDYITEGHANRLQFFVTKMAKAIGLSSSHIADLRLFAEFHDLGKVGIPDNILYKKGPLTEDEWSVMKEHPSIGSHIAQCAPDLVLISKWILCHHENWDGSGYPFGLKANEIPLECRILSIADAYDAMTNDRPYRKGMTNDEAIAELKRCSGTQFDPSLVELFINENQEGYLNPPNDSN
jgi:HD-GYP domain-containing protein (c-di-GMP phosphodiesterase class II)